MLFSKEHTIPSQIWGIGFGSFEFLLPIKSFFAKKVLIGQGTFCALLKRRRAQNVPWPIKTFFCKKCIPFGFGILNFFSLLKACALLRRAQNVPWPIKTFFAKKVLIGQRNSKLPNPIPIFQLTCILCTFEKCTKCSLVY